MKNILAYFILLVGSFVVSCKKDPINAISPVPPERSKLDIVWQKSASIDTTRKWILVHDLKNNKLLYSTSFALVSAKLRALDSSTGDLIWSFNQFLSPATGFSLSSSVFAYDNDVVILEDDGDVYAINFNSGDLVWNTSGTSGVFGSNQIADHLYTIHQTRKGYDIKSASLVRTPALNYLETWDTLYTRRAVKDSFPLLDFPVLWVNQQSDSILIFNEAQGYNGSVPSAGRGKNMLTALNIRTRKVVWQHVGINGIFSVPPLVDGDRLYVSGGPLYCYDLNTGNLLWEKNIDGADASVAFEDLLIVQSTNIGIWALNKYTGEKIWYNEDAVGGAGRLVLFEGVVYLTSGQGRLCAFDATTGVTIWKERSPNYVHPKTAESSFSHSGLVIDSTLRLLYTADGYYIMCIKLPAK